MVHREVEGLFRKATTRGREVVRWMLKEKSFGAPRIIVFDFRLFIGGQLFGRQHAYKKEIDKTLPASRTVEADGAERDR